METQADRTIQTNTGRQKDKDKTVDWAQREREEGEELKEKCRLKLDKNPHRSTSLIVVLPPSVTLINVRESDSLSF